MGIFKIISQIDIGDPSDVGLPNPQVTNVDNSIARILEILFTVLGSIAFLMMILAGLKFSLSRGNPDAATKARNTIIYALIGLVISLMAYAIVRFVVRNT